MGDDEAAAEQEQDEEMVVRSKDSMDQGEQQPVKPEKQETKKKDSYIWTFLIRPVHEDK